MKRLLTFETFVPKKIDARVKELEKITANQLVDYNLFVEQFKINLQAIQGITSNNPQEQLFIDLMQDLTVKLDQNEYPFCIYLFNDKNEYMVEYDWKSDTFWFQYIRVWSLFKGKFNIDYQDWQRFITDQVEKYFKFRPSTIRSLFPAKLAQVEKYFNFRPVTTA